MKSWSGPRAQARTARERLGTEFVRASGESVTAALLRGWDIQLAYQQSDHPLLQGARAAWREEYGLIVIDRALSRPERLFALAHELGHRACHPGGFSCLEDDLSAPIIPGEAVASDGRVWGYNTRQACETEATIFASELLVPAADARERFLAGATMEALASHYGVTTSCMANCLIGALLDAETPAVESQDSVELRLDVAQRAVAETTEARVMVDAGPGTGKTRTLIGRVLHLLETESQASSILVLTFSNRAADELRARLQAFPRGAEVMATTFHSYALDLLRRFAPQAGLPDDVRVIDDVDATLLLESELTRLGVHTYTHVARPGLYIPALLHLRGRMHDELLRTADVSAMFSKETEDDAERRNAADETVQLLHAYDRLLVARGLIDYGGLISKLVALLQADEAVARTICHNLSHVLVDEYQDVNHASVMLLQELTRHGAHLWAVGDARQAIYRFRGAHPETVAAFADNFPGGITLSLDVNYRATPALVGILSAVSTTLTGWPGHWQAERQAPAGSATVAIATDAASEENGIARDIAASIAAGRAPEEHAVLCRTHRQAGRMAIALAEAGLATSYIGDILLCPEVKDLLAMMELSCGPDGSTLLRLARWPEYALSSESASRIVMAAREFDSAFPAALLDERILDDLAEEEKGTLKRLAKHIDAVHYDPDPSRFLVRFLFGEAPYLRRVLSADQVSAARAQATITTLLAIARDFAARPRNSDSEGSTQAFLDYVRHLLSTGETATIAPHIAGAVQVLTIHASKGLEFPIVYVPNLAEGRFPPRARSGVRVAIPKAMEQNSDDDERCLFFVALSRASEQVELSRAARYGQQTRQESKLLRTLLAVQTLPELHWHTDTPASFVGTGQTNRVSVSAADIETMGRCPAHLAYLRSGARGDHGSDYVRYARLLRAAIARLRSGELEASTWDELSQLISDWWQSRWPTEEGLSEWYRGLALTSMQRVFSVRNDGQAASAVYSSTHTVEIAGNEVSVTVDAIEEVDGQRTLIMEQPTRREGDDRSLKVALYSAVAESWSPDTPAPVILRYLDTGEMRPVEISRRSRSMLQRRLELALSDIGREHFPMEPHEYDACRSCPVVLVCER